MRLNESEKKALYQSKLHNWQKAREGIEPPSTESESVVITATLTGQRRALRSKNLFFKCYLNLHISLLSFHRAAIRFRLLGRKSYSTIQIRTLSNLHSAFQRFCPGWNSSIFGPAGGQTSKNANDSSRNLQEQLKIIQVDILNCWICFMAPS